MIERTRSLTALVLLSAALLPGCGIGEAGVPAQQQALADSAPLPVETVLSYRSDIYATFETTATIEADAEAPVPARVPGEVIEILAEEGDRVTEGQVIARLDGERLALETRQAKARLEMASRELERLGRLRERGLVSEAAVESLKFERDALAASYELMRLNYDYTKIRSPISGVISAREIKLGTQVNEGTPAFHVSGTARLVVHLLIPQTELSRLSAGNEIRVHADARPEQQFRASIARISPTIDVRNGTFRATAYIDNEDGQLAPGMFGRFSIAYEKHASALVIPSDAILQEDNESIVYVVTEGAASRRSVKLGIVSNGRAEVLDGLEESEKVVVTGHGSLRDGSRVLASTAGAGRTAG